MLRADPDEFEAWHAAHASSPGIGKPMAFQTWIRLKLNQAAGEAGFEVKALASVKKRWPAMIALRKRGQLP